MLAYNANKHDYLLLKDEIKKTSIILKQIKKKRKTAVKDLRFKDVSKYTIQILRLKDLLNLKLSLRAVMKQNVKLLELINEY